MRAAWCRLGVIDACQGGHPLAVRLLPGCQPGAHLALAGGRLGGGRPQRPGPHHDPLGIRGDHQQRRGGARHRDAGGVEGGDVPGGVYHGLLDLPLADHRPAAAGDRRVRGLERAARGLQHGQARQGMGVPGRRQRQGRIGRVKVARSRAAPGAPGHLHRAEQRGQQPAVAGLQPGPRDPVRPRHGTFVLPGGLLLPRRAQVQVVLHHLPLHLPPPVGDELFKLVGGQPGRPGGLQLSDQRGDQLHRGSEGVSTPDRGIRFHRALLPVRSDGLAPSNLGRRARYHPGFATSAVSVRAGRVNSPGPASASQPRSTSRFSFDRRTAPQCEEPVCRLRKDRGGAGHLV